MKAKLKFKIEMGGFWKIEGVKPDGSRRVLADWFPNLITTIGLNRIGSGGIGSHCQIGSGSTAPAFGDTTLVNLLFGTSIITATANGSAASAPYYGWTRRTWRFNAGQGTGNISEVACAWAASGSIASRALVLDGLGAPTTITKLPDELIDVTYELRMYAPTADVVGTFNVDADTHAYVLRAASVTAWGTSAIYDIMSVGATNTPNVVAFDGDIAAVTASPSGSNLGGASATFDAYANNSYKRDFRASFALAQGNDPGGIKSFLIVAYGIGVYQFNVDPTIMKTSSDVLTIDGSYSWARKP